MSEVLFTRKESDRATTFDNGRRVREIDQRRRVKEVAKGVATMDVCGVKAVFKYSVWRGGRQER